jgi:hypothetical protein
LSYSFVWERDYNVTDSVQDYALADNQKLNVQFTYGYTTGTVRTDLASKLIAVQLAKAFPNTSKSSAMSSVASAVLAVIGAVSVVTLF